MLQQLQDILKSITENLKTTSEERDKLKTEVTSLTQELNKVKSSYGNTRTYDTIMVIN